MYLLEERGKKIDSVFRRNPYSRVVDWQSEYPCSSLTSIVEKKTSPVLPRRFLYLSSSRSFDCCAREYVFICSESGRNKYEHFISSFSFGTSRLTAIAFGGRSISPLDSSFFPFSIVPSV